MERRKLKTLHVSLFLQQKLIHGIWMKLKFFKNFEVEKGNLKRILFIIFLNNLSFYIICISYYKQQLDI